MYLTNALTTEANGAQLFPGFYDCIDAHGAYTPPSIPPRTYYDMPFNAREKEEYVFIPAAETQGSLLP